jgi:hypothetical protein
MFDKRFFFTPLLSFLPVFGSGIRDPRSEIRDPRSEIRDPGWVKIRIRDTGSGINIPDPQHWWLQEMVGQLNLFSSFGAVNGSEMEKKIRIRDRHSGSATLAKTDIFRQFAFCHVHILPVFRFRIQPDP